MSLMQTERLEIRPVEPKNSDFIIRLVNSPGWLQFIGDRNIHTQEEALAYITRLQGALAGTGTYVAYLKDDNTPVGIGCIIKRDCLDHIDIGYALLPEYYGKGYAFEISEAMIELATNTFGKTKLYAIIDTDNEPSIKLIKKLGFKFGKLMRLDGETKDIMLFEKIY